MIPFSRTSGSTLDMARKEPVNFVQWFPVYEALQRMIDDSNLFAE